MTGYWMILENGDVIEKDDEIFNYIFMEWQPLNGEWLGKQCDSVELTKGFSAHMPVRRPVTEHGG